MTATLERTLDRYATMPVALDGMTVGCVLQFNLYIQQDRSNQPVLYRSRDYALKQSDLDGLRQKGVQTLFVETADAPAYRAHLRQQVLLNEDIPITRRYQMLCEATRIVLTETLRSGTPQDVMGVTTDIGMMMADTVCQSQTMLGDLVEVMSYDYDTYTHAMNVATFCLSLARSFGICDQQELVLIGQGALLHDIGKRYIPLSILEKPGRLTDTEQTLVMQHPTRGFKDYCSRTDLSWGQLMMIYQHHERCDGGGYPSRVCRGEIHEYARICAIADVTDALLRDRPYRKGVLRSQVAAYLDRQSGSGFDEELVRCWIATIQEQI